MLGKIKYERLKIEKENPVTTANVFSILTFWWMNSILQIGSKRQIENEDLYKVLYGDKTKIVTEILRDAWAINHGQKDPPGYKYYRLFGALLKMAPLSQYLVLISIGLLAAICNMSQPVFLGMILSILLGLPGSDRNHLYVYAGALCFSSLVRVFLLHQLLYKAWLMAMRWRTATMGLMFNKVTT